METTTRVSMSKDINKDRGSSSAESKAGSTMVSGKMDK
jgi:hypothetical protein